MLSAVPTFAYGLVSASSASSTSTGEFVDAWSVRTVWSVDARGRRHGEELTYRDAERLLSRIAWGREQVLVSCRHHPDGVLSLRRTDRFPWGVVRHEQFAGAGWSVERRKWCVGKPSGGAIRHFRCLQTQGVPSSCARPPPCPPGRQG